MSHHVLAELAAEGGQTHRCASEDQHGQGDFSIRFQLMVCMCGSFR